MGTPEETIFNPFEDRPSRDLRNELSTLFSNAFVDGDTTPLHDFVEQCRGQKLPQSSRAYLEDRYPRYQKALAAPPVQQNQALARALSRGVLLWDLGLLFEVHEVLENAWYSAKGEEKLTLQAMIRAAGAYIKKEFGYDAPAARLAAKARPVIERNRSLLAPYLQVDVLLAGLTELKFPAPEIG